MVVALITTLVLFIAGIAEGLGAGNREFIEKLNAQLVVYQEQADLQITASRVGLDTSRDLRTISGVEAAGAIAVTNVSLSRGEGETPLRVTLIGVQPGQPGEPPVIRGEGLFNIRADETIIDANIASRLGVDVGDTITVLSVEGTKEKAYDVRVVGVTDSRQFFIQPTLVVPYLTHLKLSPRGGPIVNTGAGDPPVSFNVVAVRLNNPEDVTGMEAKITRVYDDLEAADIVTAYQNTPGYSAQQSTLDTQRWITLLIGVLIVGGFFRIQTIQKIAQVGVLKAIGTPNWQIVAATLFQITIINTIGVLIGGLITFGLTLVIPPTVPISIPPAVAAATLGSLLLIGPLGGAASVGVLLKAEPLRALGMAQ
jgi:putative ABC transport system permease protein